MSDARNEIFNIIDKNDASAMKQYLQGKDWKTLFKITCTDRNRIKNPLEYATDKGAIKALNEMVNIMLQEGDFFDANNEYSLGDTLTSLSECTNYVCDTPWHVLVQNLITLGAPSNRRIDYQYALHFQIDHAKPNHELIKVLCDHNGQLDNLCHDMVPAVYAATKNKWDIVQIIANKNPKHFAKHALKVWEIAIKNNIADNSLKFFLNKLIFQELSGDVVNKIKEKFANEVDTRKPSNDPSKGNILFQFVDGDINETQLEEALAHKTKDDLIGLFKTKNIRNDTVIAYESYKRKSNWEKLYKLLLILKDNKITETNCDFLAGHMLLSLACCNSYSGTIEQHQLAELIIQIAKQSYVNQQGQCGLHLAIANKLSKEMIDVLCIDSMINYQIPESGVPLPIIYAAQCDHWDAVKWIAAKFENFLVTERDKLLEIAIYHGKQNELLQIFSAAKSRNAKAIGLTLLISYTKYDGNPPKHELAKKLIQDGAAINIWDSKSALHIAIDNDDGKELIDVLCDQKGLLNKKCNGLVPILYAAKHNKWDIVKWIALKNPNHFKAHAAAIFQGGMSNINKKKALSEFILSLNTTDKDMLGLSLTFLTLLTDYNGSTPKHELTKKYIQSGASIFTLNGKSAMCIAIDNGASKEMIEALCEQDKLLDQIFKDMNPLIYAAKNDKWDMVKWMAEKMPNLFINTSTELNNIATQNKKLKEWFQFCSELNDKASLGVGLAYTIKYSPAADIDSNLVKKFVSNKPQMRYVDNKSPLHIAIDNNFNKAVIEELCEMDTALDIVCVKQVPVVYAASNKKFDILKWIAEKNQVNFLKYASDILQLSLDSHWSETERNSILFPLLKYKSILSLLSKEPDKLLRCFPTFTVRDWLFIAIESNCLDLLKALIPIVKKNLKIFEDIYTLVGSRDLDKNMTLLEYACKNNSSDFIQYIAEERQLTSKKNANIISSRLEINKYHLSECLYWTVKNKNHAHAKMFLEHGIPFSFNGSGSRELNEAIKSFDVEMVLLLLKFNANLNPKEGYAPLIIALNMKYGLKEDKEKLGKINMIITLLLTSNSVINSSNGKESEALILAVKNNDTLLAKTLIEKHNAVLTTIKPENQLILLAVQQYNKELVTLLLIRKAPVNLYPSVECPALLCAVKESKDEIVSLLLNAGATVNADKRTDHGNEVLYLACTNKKPEIVHLLLHFGADFTRKLSNNISMEEYASSIGSKECATEIETWRKDKNNKKKIFLISMNQELSQMTFSRPTYNLFGKESGQENFVPEDIEKLKIELQKLDYLVEDNEVLVSQIFQAVLALLRRYVKTLKSLPTSEGSLHHWFIKQTQNAEQIEYRKVIEVNYTSSSSTTSSSSSTSSYSPSNTVFSTHAQIAQQFVLHAPSEPSLLVPTFIPMENNVYYDMSHNSNPYHTQVNDTPPSVPLLTNNVYSTNIVLMPPPSQPTANVSNQTPILLPVYIDNNNKRT